MQINKYLGKLWYIYTDFYATITKNDLLDPLRPWQHVSCVLLNEILAYEMAKQYDYSYVKERHMKRK